MVRPGAHAVLVFDGAGWHRTGGRLAVPDNISMLLLPGYAPELNPVENVWEYLRGNHLNISVWDSHDEIVKACCHAWNAFINDTARIISLTQQSWAKVSL
jgi:transposase